MPGLSGPLPSPDAIKPGRSRHVPLGTAPEHPPDHDVRWRRDTCEAWDRFWESPLIGVAIDADVPSMQRLFSYYDIWRRVYTDYAAAGDMIGADRFGSDMVSPYLVTMLKVEAAIDKLEERFGITPLIRVKIGIKIGGAINSADKLNRPARKRRAGAIDVEADPE